MTSIEPAWTAVADVVPGCAVAIAVATWVEGAAWITICVWPDPPGWVGSVATACWVCLASWVTVLEFVAVAAALELFVWVAVALVGIQMRISDPTTPDPFGSTAEGSTEMEMLAFVGAVCVEVAVAVESCDVGADWLMICDCPLAPPAPS